MLDRTHTVEVRFGQVYQDRVSAPQKVPMPRPIAWGIVVAFTVAMIAIVVAPFVGKDFRVLIGFAAAGALLVLFALIGAVHSMRNER